MPIASFLCCITLQSVACFALLPFCASSVKRNEIRSRFIEKQCRFRFSLQMLSETFLILRSQRDVITSVNKFSSKLLAFFSEFNHTWTCRQIFEKSSNIKFYENSPGWNQFLHTDRRAKGRTDTLDEANSCFSQYCDCV